MTRHPAAPTKPWTDPGAARAELDDLAAMCRDAGYTGPLRDVVAHLTGPRHIADALDAVAAERLAAAAGRTDILGDCAWADAEYLTWAAEITRRRA